MYELDVFVNEREHEVIRLPPYHCQYNPTELVCAQVKREVTKKKIISFKIVDAERLALAKVTKDQ